MTRYLPLALLFLFAPVVAWSQPDLTPPGPPPNVLPDLPAEAEQEGVEPLTKGPIHEAFADPADPDPEPSPIVAKAPPAEVQEQPAAYKPEGDFVWIPGYWNWDDDRDDFIWVTGVWRQPPPDMHWVPGYWNEVNGGFQRVKGFWLQDEVQEVTYYSQPPASLEAGPSSPAPASNYFWIPGSWSYVNTDFTWQAGYWAPYQQDWVYVPARWVWTPAGFVYLPGYWDYRLSSRGQIFAPVYFRSPVYASANWYYRPSIVIPTSNLFIHLWIQPRHNCYYFGNYFGPQYANRGFISWSNLHSHRHGFYHDPFYSYAHVHYRRQGVDYLGRVKGWHDYYDHHPEHRPPATFHEQREWQRSPAARAVSGDAQLVARPIAEVARQTDAPLKLSPLNDRARQSQTDHARQIRELDVQRKNLERQHTQVNFNRGPDRSDQPRDPSKTGSLVDRLDKGDKGERGDKGDKGDKGRNSPPGAGSEIAKATPTAKLSLPKIEMPKNTELPKSADLPKNAGKGPRAPLAADLPKASERPAAPPLPRGDKGPRGGDRQDTAASPQNVLPDGAKGPSRSTFGTKTSELPRFPGRPDEPRVPGRDGPEGRGPRDGNANNVTGRQPNDSPPRGGEIPGLPPGGKTTPNLDPRGRTNPPGDNVPNNSPPNNSRFDNPPNNPSRNNTPRDNAPRNFTPPNLPNNSPQNIGPPTKAAPTNAPRENSPPQRVNPQNINSPKGNAPANPPREATTQPRVTPPIGNRDGGAPRNDQPTFRGSNPRPSGGNVNPPQSQPQPSRAPSRQESGGSTSENKKKGKDKD